MTLQDGRTHRLLSDEGDLERMRALLRRLRERASVVDFEEQMLQPSIRARARLWLEGDECAAFAWVDDYDHLWFELDPSRATPRLERAVVDWGVESIRLPGQPGPRNLDASCEAGNTERLALLERNGFAALRQRSLCFARSLSEPPPEAAMPGVLALRPVRGQSEVDALVALHRACFGTDRMTAEARLALMRAPSYMAELDMVAMAPGGELAGFCVGGFVDETRPVGHTDPIGVHPNYRRRGLGRAMVAAVLGTLRDLGAETAELGTSSENLAMCCLAESLGYRVVSERVWFSLPVQ
jgi:ribosomal protein S18 acetylase RimI-like enzyme